MTPKDILDRLRPRPPGQTESVDPKVIERIVVEKFDKTHVMTPGVEGLTPFEVIVIEDGRIVERTVQGG